MKTYRVNVTYPDLPSAHAEYSYPVTASNLTSAVGKGIRLASQEPHLHRKHLKR
jgi:hypothetical protein